MMVSTVNDWQRRGTLGILVGVWLLLVVPMAAAQEVDSRWAPWIGCWRGVDETAPATAPAEAPLLCVVPLADEAAIEMLTVVDGQVVSRESIFADGQQHAVSREECEGWERAEFSGDSRRIYIRSELTCGSGGPRSSTGVMSMVLPSEWLDVRTVDVDGQSLPWVLRYRQASRADFQAAGQADLIGMRGSDTRMARMAASIPIALDDVIEAVEKVSAETVEIWVIERAEPFALDASRLIKMADAGVPASVIDVVVAVSYPEKFVVNSGYPLGPPGMEAGERRGRSGYGDLNPFEDPFYDPYARYGYYSPYGYGSRYRSGFGYYGPYGYGYDGFGGYRGYGYGYGGYGYGYGGYGGFGGYGYGPIIVVGRSSGETGGGVSGSTRGRVARGGGYTSAGSGGGNTGRSAQPRSSGSSRSSGSAASSRGSSGRSSAAPARRSSSSSPQSTGRRAQPRPRGGN